MNMRCLILPSLVLFLLGACRTNHRADRTTTAPKLEIQNVAATAESLTIDYTVSNLSEDDIWVCEDIDDHHNYRQQAATTIEGHTLFVRRRIKLDFNHLPHAAPVARYRRLAPGASRPARLSLVVPVRNSSPVYIFGTELAGLPREGAARILGHEPSESPGEAAVRRCILEVGYFPGWFVRSKEAACKEMANRDPNDTRPLSELPGIRHLKLAHSDTETETPRPQGQPSIPAFEVREEIQNGTSDKVVYVHFFPYFLIPEAAREWAAHAVCEDVAIPCAVTQGGEVGRE